MTTFTPDAITAWLTDHPNWSLGDDGMLHADYMFKNFTQAMQFANAVAFLAETADHHPDMVIHGYKHVRVSVMSHDRQGITERDFKLITQIDNLPGFGA
ncbi:MAG: 4a-hydroxytetrahydrobiopterin dehydratase [Anaerolineae bacterium]|nr:4a-hydroxytetrahydrobiopterin dehydratase [Anaerolineae bacterium]